MWPIDLGSDTTICNTDSIWLDAYTFGNVEYLWQDGSTSPFYQTGEAGVYEVVVTSPCETLTDAIEITSIVCKEDICDVFVPTLFTPNGDGNNDRAGVSMSGDCFRKLEKYVFKIYNRWGEQVFSANIPFEDWDGTFRGKDAPVGVYVWFYEFTIQGETYFDSGDITLIK